MTDEDDDVLPPRESEDNVENRDLSSISCCGSNSQRHLFHQAPQNADKEEEGKQVGPSQVSADQRTHREASGREIHSRMRPPGDRRRRAVERHRHLSLRNSGFRGLRVCVKVLGRSRAADSSWCRQVGNVRHVSCFSAFQTAIQKREGRRCSVTSPALRAFRSRSRTNLNIHRGAGNILRGPSRPFSYLPG